MRNIPLAQSKFYDYMWKHYSSWTDCTSHSDKLIKELGYEKIYRVTWLNTQTAHVIFNDGREIHVTYQYNTGKTFEVEIDPTQNYFDLMKKQKDQRIDVSLTLEEYRFLNMFRTMTGKQQYELQSKLQDLAIQFITEKN